MSFFDEDFPKDPYEDEIECDECICDECNASFLIPSDTELDSCPVCGCSYDN